MQQNQGFVGIQVHLKQGFNIGSPDSSLKRGTWEEFRERVEALGLRDVKPLCNRFASRMKTQLPRTRWLF